LLQKKKRFIRNKDMAIWQNHTLSVEKQTISKFDDDADQHNTFDQKAMSLKK
jgi:hypothetical protein